MARKWGHCRVSEWETNNEMMGPISIKQSKVPNIQMGTMSYPHTHQGPVLMGFPTWDKKNKHT